MPTNDHSPVSTKNRSTAIILGMLLVWLLILRPQIVTASVSSPSLSNLLQLSLFPSVFFLAWWLRHQGLAICSFLLFSLSYPYLSQPGTSVYMLKSAMGFLLITFVQIALCWEIGLPRFRTRFWGVLAVLQAIAFALLLPELGEASNLLSDPLLLRSLVCAELYSICGGLYCLLFVLRLRRRNRDQIGSARSWFAAFAIAVLIPAGVLGYMFSNLEFGDIQNACRWDDFFQDIRRTSDSMTWDVYCLLCLLVLGAWRILARGDRQRKQLQMPVGWIFLIGVWFMVVLFSGQAREVLLILIALIIPYGILDIGQLFIEQISLPTPIVHPASETEIVWKQ